MIFEAGFLGTRAAAYMDAVTLYFAVLPLLVLGAIFMAMKGKRVWHMRAQIAIFAMTLVMVVVFEMGVRIEGGFAEFVKNASMPFAFMVVYLIIHILIAMATVASWLALIIASYRRLKHPELAGEFFSGNHQYWGRWVFAGIVMTALTGCSIYAMLFVF